MLVRYNKLWKMLVDKKWKKTDLQQNLGVSWGVVIKLSKDKIVSLEHLVQILDNINNSI